MGIGGTLDVVAGHVRRAPLALQRAGLEWAYRMVQEPQRLGPRYLFTNVVFAGMLARQLFSRLARRCGTTIERVHKGPDTRATRSDRQ